jgi:hypothetical protein
MEPNGRRFQRKSSVTPSVERSLPPRRGLLRRPKEATLTSADEDEDYVVIPNPPPIVQQKSFLWRRKTARRSTLQPVASLDPPPVTTILVSEGAASMGTHEVSTLSSSFARDVVSPSSNIGSDTPPFSSALQEEPEMRREDSIKMKEGKRNKTREVKKVSPDPPAKLSSLLSSSSIASAAAPQPTESSRATFSYPAPISSETRQEDQETSPPPITALMKRTKPLLSHFQTNTPITKHYDISQQILYAFESYHSSAYYMMAYTFGLQYVETVLLEIPKHGYYLSKKHASQRLQSSLQAAYVGHELQKMLQEEEQKTRDDDTTASSLPLEDVEHVQSLIALAMEQIEQASLEEPATNSGSSVCDPLLNLTAACCGGGGRSAASSSPPLIDMPMPRSSSAQQLLEEQMQLYRAASSSSSTKKESRRSSSAVIRTLQQQQALLESYARPPPSPVTKEPSVLTLPPPPTWGLVRQNTTSSFASYQSSEEKLQLEKALFLSGLEVSTGPSQRSLVEMRVPILKEAEEEKKAETLPPPSNSHTVLELSTLKQLYHEDFDSLQRSGRVRISFVDTFQGRIPESTNGCTVIAPLLCVHHLNTPVHEYTHHTTPAYYDAATGTEHISDPGLPDATVMDVMDVEAPVALTELRETLGLAAHAFLIPADAHDYLMEQGQITESQFITVTGGNILNDDHLQAFITLLESQSPERKIAATLFFHEHVVAILQLRRIDPLTGRTQQSWYDIIDSLPNPETLRRSEHETMEDLYWRVGGSATEWRPKTARFRCLDVDALGAVLKWYACSKFNSENISYIDQYAWDEATCDFDPRVFQAYIWGSTPKQS